MSRRTNVPALCALQMEHSCDDPSAAFALCRERSVLGLGWGVDPSDEVRDAAAAMSRRRTGIHPAVRAFIDLPEGALVWTRDPDDGTFYLAEICGPWTYFDDLEATAADLHNVRPVKHGRVSGSDSGPGARCQRVHRSLDAPAPSQLDDDAPQRRRVRRSLA